MKAQATLEFMMIFLVTIAAVMMVFYPLARAHNDFSAQADFLNKKQQLEDFLVGMQIYCNGGPGTSVLASAESSGCEVFVHYGEVKFRCDGREQRFPGFFQGCVVLHAEKPI